MRSRRWHGRRRRGRVDWELVGGAVILVVALAAAVYLMLENAGPSDPADPGARVVTDR